MKKIVNFAVLGPGKIAEVVLHAIREKVDFTHYAVASRDMERATTFKEKHGFIKAYGTYEELYQDEQVDLVYIATPHAFHYEQMKECITHGKHVICEKAFTLNATQAEEILTLAKEHGVLVAEAMLTAYLPSRNLIRNLLDSKEIGEVISYNGVFTSALMHVERVVTKSLGGGALLDIGIYPLYFAISMFGTNFKIKDIQIKQFQDIDASTSFTLTYPNGFKANIYTSIEENKGVYGDIIGTNGRIHIENIARPSEIIIYDQQGNVKRRISSIKDTNGYEYEFQAVLNALQEEKLECSEMTPKDTLFLMQTMDYVLSEIRI